MWELFEHTADLGIRGLGSSVKEAFTETALAMFSQMADLSYFPEEESLSLSCEGDDEEELLVDFLNRLLTLSAIHQIIFVRFVVTELSNTHLTAQAWGTKISGKNKDYLKSEIKAATFSQLKVAKQNGKYIAQCVVDV